MISAEEYKKLTDLAFRAYQNHNVTNQEYRQLGRVPYTVHPMWCATMLICDTKIPRKQRELGFKALILHDVLEDTDMTLPKWVEPRVQKIVQELTFESPADALKQIFGKSHFIKLLLLIDMLASMYEDHVSPHHRGLWKKAVHHLIKEVEEKYGNTRIVQVAKVIHKNTDW
ncbi:MAG: hypothetical protein ABH826_01145 [Patescibacteria group bacterium]